MRILHISDLHFSVPTDGERSQKARKLLIDTVSNRGIEKVIVTGDFQDANSIAEYKKSAQGDIGSAVSANTERIIEFLDGLKQSLGIKAEDFAFVPGNHDCSCDESYRRSVERTLESYDMNEGCFAVGEISKLNERFEFFWGLCDKFYVNPRNNPWRGRNAVQPCVTLFDPGLCVVLLNSSVVSFAGKGRPHILYDRNAIDCAVSNFLSGKPRVKRIIFCAHNSIHDMGRDELPNFIKMLRKYQSQDIRLFYFCGDAHSEFVEERSGIKEYRIGSLGGKRDNQLTFSIYNIADSGLLAEKYEYRDNSGKGEWSLISDDYSVESLKARNKEQFEQMCGVSGRYFLHLSELEEYQLSRYIQNEDGVRLGEAIDDGARFLNIIGESGAGKTTALLTRWKASVEGSSGRISLFVPMNMISEKCTVDEYIREKYSVPVAVLKTLAREDRIELLLDAFDESGFSLDDMISFIGGIKNSDIRLVITSTRNFFTATSARELFSFFRIVEFNESTRNSILSDYSIMCENIAPGFLDNAMHVSWYIDSHKSIRRRRAIHESHGINVDFLEGSFNPISLFTNRLRAKLCELIEEVFFSRDENSVFYAYADLFWISPVVCNMCEANGIIKITDKTERAVFDFLLLSQPVIKSRYLNHINFTGRNNVINIGPALLEWWKQNTIFFRKGINESEYIIDSKYVEYFRAIHIANAILLSCSRKKIHSDINNLFLPRKLVRFSLYRIEQDSIRFCSESASSIPEPFCGLIEILRNKSCDNYPYALANVVSFLRELSGRDSDIPYIENADLSSLDFKNTKSNGIFFKNCRFTNSHIYRDSITPQGHSGDISSICFLPDSNGKYFISASYDSDLRIWNAESGNCIFVLTCKPHSFIHNIAFSKDGRQLAVALRNGYVNLYNYSNCRLYEAASIKLHSAPVWSARFDRSGTKLLTASEDGRVQVYNTISERVTFCCETGDDVICAVYNEDSSKILACLRNFQILEWDVEISKLPSARYRTDESDGFLTCVTYDPRDPKKFYSCSENGVITEWLNGEPSRNFSDSGIKSGGTEKAHMNWIYSICCSKEKPLLASSSFDGSAKIWNTADGSLYRTYPNVNSGSSLRCAVINDAGEYLITGSVDGRIASMDIHNPGEAMSYPGQNRSLINISLADDGSRLLAPGENFHIQEYLVSNTGGENEYRRNPDEFEGHTDSVIYSEYSADGRYVVSSSYDFSVKLWDSHTQRIIWSRQHENAAMSARFCPCEPCVLSASYDGSVIEWPIENGCEFRYYNSDGRSVRTAIYATLRENDNRIVIGNFGGRIVEVDRGSREELACYQHPDYGIIMSMDLSGDGNFLLSASDRNLIIEWDRKNQKEQFRYDCRSAIYSVQYSKNNNFILAALFNGEIWEWRRGHVQEPLHIYKGHEKPVTYAIYNADNSKILSTSYDGTIKEWKRPASAETKVQSASKNVATVISGLHYSNCSFVGAAFDSDETKNLLLH